MASAAIALRPVRRALRGRRRNILNRRRAGSPPLASPFKRGTIESMNRITRIILFSVAAIALALMVASAPAVATKLITGKDIRNGSVQELDLDAKTRTKLNNLAVPATGAQGERGATGATGIQGPKGSKGEQGEQGASVTGPQGDRGFDGKTGPVGPSGQPGPKGDPGRDSVAHLDYRSEVTDAFIPLAGEDFSHPLKCDGDQTPIGGGYRVTSGDITIKGSYPDPVSPNASWIIEGHAGPGSGTLVVYVTCIDR